MLLDGWMNDLKCMGCILQRRRRLHWSFCFYPMYRSGLDVLMIWSFANLTCIHTFYFSLFFSGYPMVGMDMCSLDQVENLILGMREGR
jgi:hypothetical protein